MHDDDEDALVAQGCLHIIRNFNGVSFLLKLETAVMIPMQVSYTVHLIFSTCSLCVLFSRDVPMFHFSHTLLSPSVIRRGFTLS